jgi:hypothetical protein
VPPVTKFVTGRGLGPFVSRVESNPEELSQSVFQHLLTVDRKVRRRGEGVARALVRECDWWRVHGQDTEANVTCSCLSPDGTWLVYGTTRGIYVHEIGLSESDVEVCFRCWR